MHVSNGKGRLYGGLQDRNTRIRGNMLGLSKTSIFQRVLQHEVRISQQFNINMNESNNAAEVAAALYNNKLYQYLTMPLSSLPRHPREEAELRTKSLKVIVCSDRLELQHKASCYHGHGYPNRLIFPAGVHWRDSTRSDLQGGVHLVREHPTEAIRHSIAHLSNSAERPSAGLNPKYARLWTLTPTYFVRCVAGRRSASKSKKDTVHKQIRHTLPGRRPRYCRCLKSPRTRPCYGGAHTCIPTGR